MKANTLLSQSASARKIETGEQELWLLTAVDCSGAVKIEAKVREIEMGRGNERIAFIQAVGEASKVLTSEQRAQLLDENPSTDATWISPAVARAILTAAPLKGTLTP